jgi:hypothetical protein
MIKASWLKRIERAESGQSLVEMAVSMVILVMLLSGVLDLGRLYFTYVALEDAVGEAALYLAIHPNCAEETVDCPGTHNARWRAEHAVGYSLINWDGDRAPVVTPISDETLFCGTPIFRVGATVTVNIDYDFYLLSPLVPAHVPVNPIPIRLTATQTVIAEDEDIPEPTCP